MLMGFNKNKHLDIKNSNPWAVPFGHDVGS